MKKRVAVLLGGKSGEHEVSLVSASNVARALDPKKYDVQLVGIDQAGVWRVLNAERTEVLCKNPRQFKFSNTDPTVLFAPFKSEQSLQVLDAQAASVKFLKKFDVVLPILHGTYGEDGTIQGLLELAQVPYVGSGVVGSSVGMDKDVSRRLMREAGIPVVPTKVLRRYEYEKSRSVAVDGVIAELGLPFFVKPANMGSSVGVHKVKTRDEAEAKIAEAFLYDTKVLAEKAIDARELECAVLGNHEPQASPIGEIIPQHEFYSYEAKYLDENGAHLNIPAQNLGPEIEKQIKRYAIQVFQVLELRGLARVDFFLDKKTSQLYLNEVNTMPGFTQISMYPKMWMATGMTYAALIDRLVDHALEIHAERSALKTTFA